MQFHIRACSKHTDMKNMLNRSIQASASGSTEFTFKLNTYGTYQATGVFNNITPGTYTAFAKDTDGCEKNSIRYR